MSRRFPFFFVTQCSPAILLWLFLTPQVAFGMATERIGPDSAHDHPTVQQPDWPSGILKMARLDSRVYSTWVHGNELFYYKLKSEEFKSFVKAF